MQFESRNENEHIIIEDKGQIKRFNLVEVIVSLAILGLIVYPLKHVCIFRIKQQKVEDILDATYIAQSIIETRYGA